LKRHSTKEAARRWNIKYRTLQRKIWYDNEHGRPMYGTSQSEFHERSWAVTEEYMIKNYGPEPKEGTEL
jgi:hypothetical protein